MRSARLRFHLHPQSRAQNYLLVQESWTLSKQRYYAEESQYSHTRDSRNMRSHCQSTGARPTEIRRRLS